MRCRSVPACTPLTRMLRSACSPCTLPTQTAVEIAVEEPTIQVWMDPFVVPVLPMYGVPSFGFDAEPVPPRMTDSMAYAAVFATLGETRDWPHSAFSPASTSPVATTTMESIIRGTQYTPWLAIAA